jgi:class 3 adenylate cyclase
MKRTFSGTLRPAAFGSAQAKTYHVNGASVGDPGVKIEHAAPGQSSPRLVLVHAMADLRGFTAFCERVPPDRMFRVLNEYLTAMIDVILGQQGHVQDFIGDGIFGVFGAPGQDLDHGWHAAVSASRCRSPFDSSAGDGDERERRRSAWASQCTQAGPSQSTL